MAYLKKLDRLIPLDEIKSMPGLEGLPLIRRGNRLSVMPVTDEQWHIILSKQ